ncbi:hypothetical protein BN1058_02396 [Paraliobacillus sp. PM-2]|uniref:tetratricopeptide repeat protein n=1 Tax=Paraliobacillus sp. PM-2 TaxID=1462524 RepID=UPI00061C66C1|nr:hypothetical protein [Paraliobacillus sp. PM-2]CQR48054.1 hypothetical protein BN1058_02396 [Paraliobacillus sp. PM-2]
MEQHDKKVVIFPKWKDKIEEKAFQLVRDKRYQDALEQLNILLDYKISNQEIDMAKLTCFIELGKQKEAEILCEELLAKKDDYYFAYVHIYATLLFQANKYKNVSELIDDVFDNEEQVPEPYRSQLNTLYQLNDTLLKEQTDKQTTATLQQLEEAVKKEDNVLQWHLVNHLHHTDITPFISSFKNMLVDPLVNPMVKTVILSLLQANDYNGCIEIEKFSKKMKINPNSHPYMTDDPIYKKVKKELEDIEQKNPSLYQLADQMLYRYFFVLYPFISENIHIQQIKEAIIYLASASFMDEASIQSKSVSETLALYIEDLLYYEKVYFSLMKN